jgi:hypothetical protein
MGFLTSYPILSLTPSASFGVHSRHHSQHITCGDGSRRGLGDEQYGTIRLIASSAGFLSGSWEDTNTIYEVIPVHQ